MTQSLGQLLRFVGAPHWFRHGNHLRVLALPPFRSSVRCVVLNFMHMCRLCTQPVHKSEYIGF
jgi:hypothetical protein